MICEMQSTNQMCSMGISSTSSALMIEREGIVLVTYTASSFFFGVYTSRIARIASKYWSAAMRTATALPSGRSIRRWAIFGGISCASGRHAAALQEGYEEDARRRQVEDVLRAGVHRAPHLHDLEGAEQVAPALEVPHDDDPVRNRLLDPVRRRSLLGRCDLRDEERRAPHPGEDRPEL